MKQNPTHLSAGTRVRLVSTSDPYTRLRPGTLGTVSFTDDTGTVHVHWDTGERLGMIPGEDAFVVTQEKSNGKAG